MSSNPITSAAPSSSSPITSVAPQSYSSPISAHAQGAGGNQQLVSRLNLDLRGQLFTVDRETLMLLPESVLLGLFPQGLVLTRQGGWEDEYVGVDVRLVPSLLSVHLSLGARTPRTSGWAGRHAWRAWRSLDALAENEWFWF